MIQGKYLRYSHSAPFLMATLQNYVYTQVGHWFYGDCWLLLLPIEKDIHIKFQQICAFYVCELLLKWKSTWDCTICTTFQPKNLFIRVLFVKYFSGPSGSMDLALTLWLRGYKFSHSSWWFLGRKAALSGDPNSWILIATKLWIFLLSFCKINLVLLLHSLLRLFTIEHCHIEHMH